jgi:hypothetical protein
MEAEIRSNSQGWEDARVIGERQVLMVAIKSREKGVTLAKARGE